MRWFKRKFRSATRRFFAALRRAYYRLLSNCSQIEGHPTFVQPALLVGEGAIHFDEGVIIGFDMSAQFWSSYCYLESRQPSARISIGEGTILNNNFCAVSEATEIKIGARCQIGTDVTIFDSDFHPLEPELRWSKAPPVSRKPVHIEDYVFIGAGVVILKGTQIGEGSVIGAGSVVSGCFPARSIIAGNPARLIRSI